MEENKRPLMEVLDESFRRIFQEAKSRDRVVNAKQREVLDRVCESIANVFGCEAKVTLYPVFTSGGVVARLRTADASGEKVTELKSALSFCNTLSIETLANGEIEIGVTVPGVFEPMAGD